MDHFVVRMKPASPAAFCGQILFKFDGHVNMRKHFLVRYNSVQSHTGGIYPVISAGIRSGATVGPDLCKVLYLQKHIDMLCDYVLTKFENGPLYGSTDRGRALEERPSCCRHNTAARQLLLLQHATMYSRITSTKSPQFLWQTSQNLRPSYFRYVIAATMKAEGYWHFHRPSCRNTLFHAHTTTRTLPT